MRTRSLSLGKHNYSILYRDSTDESVIEEVLIDQDYKICQRIIKDAEYPIIDIGAHIGTFELYVRSMNKVVPIICVEPASDNFEILEGNIQLNKLSHVSAHQYALAGSTGEVELNISNNNHNNSLYEPYARDAHMSKKVQAYSLNDFFELHQMSACSLLKIDCEGAEYEIFEHTSAETFSKIHAIFMEYHEHIGRSHKELVDILTSHGYTIRKIQPSKYSHTLGTMLAVR